MKKAKEAPKLRSIQEIDQQYVRCCTAIGDIEAKKSMNEALLIQYVAEAERLIEEGRMVREAEEKAKAEAKSE